MRLERELAQAANSLQHSARSSIEQPKQNLEYWMTNPLRILIVDDQHADALVVVDTLRRGGFLPDWRRVDTEAEFVSALHDHWDVILCDYATPGCNALQALELKKTYAAEVPLLIVSGSVGEDAAIEALRAGATDYLFKNRLLQLEQAVRRALEQRRERQARIEFERELRLHRRAIESSNQGFIIADAQAPDFPIIYVNSGFVQITGYQPAEVIGRSCRFLQGPKTDPAANAEIRSKLQQGQPCQVEILNYRKDGTSFWNSLTISPIQNEHGVLTHFVGIQSDITDKRELEGQLLHAQKMDAIGRLAGGVAHDFNNLLTIILGCCGFVLDAQPDAEITQLIQQIRHAGERAALLTRQLLLFSRKHVGAPELFDLNEVVTGIQLMLLRVIGPDVTLRTELDPAHPWIRADPSQFEQVILNLVINAQDAMPQGGEIVICTRTLPGEIPQVLLSVSDTGVGMSDEVQARLFEPFFTTKEVGKGTGLGLPIVFGIVRQSAGTIKVLSAPNAGTTVEIRLPLAVPEAASEEPGQREFPPQAGSETILLAEDDPQVRQLARQILQKAGYHVLDAINGKDALAVAQAYASQIQLLVTDVVMPDLNGCQLAKQLCAARPQLRVIFISGFNEESVVRHGVTAGDIPFLHKPFTNSALVRKVREVLDEPWEQATRRVRSLYQSPPEDTDRV